ncbi:MAG TPA: cytochrome P450, partial [Xanthobacteraceae bacterium]|nr:cytochrome P450 [Xanthobacteraceae bacterium]
LPRLTGERHAHYRKLIGVPLRRGNVDALSTRIAKLTDDEVATWPVGAAIDLWDFIRRLMQRLSVEFLFGGDSEESRAIAELSGAMMVHKWGPVAQALPLNLPITPYGKIVRAAEDLERRILQWAAAKRGQPNERDLASIIVNSPGPDGKAADDATIVAHISSLFALSSEGSQSALWWTLILLAQHPRAAAILRDELRGRLGETSPALEKAGELSYLDAVVKESMRILPPVPLQIRVAQCDTTIAGTTLPERTRIMLNTFLTNRMPDLYAEADTFRPERWSTIEPNPFEYPVFSAGPHLCSGYWFGSAVVKIALAAILARFRLELAPSTRIDYRTQPTLRPRQRVDVLLRPADSGAQSAISLTGNIRDLVAVAP